jgi:hypothetical protein
VSSCCSIVATPLATNLTSLFWINQGTPSDNYVDGARDEGREDDVS